MPVSARASFSEVAVPVSDEPGSAFRFPRTARLLHRSDFDRVFAEGRRSADRCFTILYCPNGTGHPRLGLAISRRRVRRAVDRNRLRRRIREHFRTASAGLPAVDLVVMAGSGVRQCAEPELAESLQRHWSRIASAASGRRTQPDEQDG